MKISRSAALGLCALALATAAACSTSESDADTTPAADPTAVPGPESIPAPAPGEPVNQLGVEPCALLTLAEAEEAVGFAPLTPTRTVDPDNPAADCGWFPADITVDVLTAVTIGDLEDDRLPDYDVSQNIAGIKVEHSNEPGWCNAVARFEEGRTMYFRLTPSAEKRAAAALGPDDSWCTQAVPTLEKILTRLDWK